MNRPFHILATLLVVLTWPGTVQAGCACMDIVYYRVDYLDHTEQQHSVVIVPSAYAFSNIEGALRETHGEMPIPSLTLAEKMELALLQQEPGSQGWPVLEDTWVLQPAAIESSGLPEYILQPVVFTVPGTDFLHNHNVFHITNVEHLFDLNCMHEVQVTSAEMEALRGKHATLTGKVIMEPAPIEGMLAVYHATLQFSGLERTIPVSFIGERSCPPW